MEPVALPYHHHRIALPHKTAPVYLNPPEFSPRFSNVAVRKPASVITIRAKPGTRRRTASEATIGGGGAPPPPLDLTEDNIRLVLSDARVELAQLFDGSVGITGEVDLAELDGPFVKISLRGRFWHTRSTVLARIGNYLKQRIPEILEVDIEDEKQLDDSPANF
ncbi:PREDICTED: uncharacterized protein LOC104816015 [Tarenaya hassleriana]|uniref:uncharacterized protein LOC104816015 n=1 Tax=Tarenaya hassleriana TaxID=28532 RepID=UPI00053CA362|nr:PREDICTED: uncharacterized protein LOC104816015 [Tarenaya hassleriana]